MLAEHRSHGNRIAARGRSSIGNALPTIAVAGDHTCLAAGTPTGTVTFLDYSIMQDNYNQTGRDWAQGDWNNDGTVNFSDYSMLQNNYQQSVAN